MIRRLWMVLSAVAVTTFWTVVTISAQGTSGAAQTDFQPLRDDQIVQEQLPAVPLVFAAYAFVWFALLVYVVSLWRRVSRVEQELAQVSSLTAGQAPMNFAEMPSSHFLFIPSVLLIGVVVGWVLGSRAARDAYAAELRRRDERQARKTGQSH